MICDPGVRHLLWMCSASPLWQSAASFALADFLPRDWRDTLQLWNDCPDEAPAFLRADPHPRLGQYFETLYEGLLTHLLGWEVLVRNLPIRECGVTLGELDFVVRNPISGAVEHHEVAVKFYLGYQAQIVSPLQWLGPNPADRLELKAHRMLEEQSQRTYLPAALEALHQLGIEGPLPARVFMPGYLFYPVQSAPVVLPAEVPRGHARGSWMRLADVQSEDVSNWVPLHKPHWLGPWQQAAAPQHSPVHEALSQIAKTSTPRLFACVAFAATQKLWCETHRIFVVPSSWPERLPRPLA